MSREAEILLAGELHRPSLAKALARGEIERLRRGAYRAVPDGTTVPQEDARGRARARAAAVHRQLRATHTFSHETAALLWGCALWRLPGRTHVTQSYRASGQAAADLARHAGDPARLDRTVRDGLPVTSMGRTIVDCALTMHPLEALVIADSARRLGLDLVRAREQLAARPTRNGRSRAGWVLDHADGGADSPWETWLRYVCLRAGLPRPVTQAPVHTPRGLYHCDLGWPEHEVFAEFDGRVKYRDDGVRPGHDGSRELLREKARYEAVREAGVDPVRVLATGPGGVAAVVARIASRFPPEIRGGFRVDPLLPPPP